VTAGISGAVNAFSFSLETNTLEIGGALTLANLAPNGVINTTLASPTVFGNIRPVGATNLGPTLGVNVNVPSTAYIPVGTEFDIVKTQTGTPQSGTNNSVVAVTVQNPTNPLYTFSAAPTVAGKVTIRTTGIPLQAPLQPPPGAVQPPGQPIAAAIVPVLVAINPSPDLITVLASVNALTDAGSVVNAVAQLGSSSPDLVAPLVTFQGTRQFQNLWMSRLEEFHSGQVVDSDGSTMTCGTDELRSGWWAKGFGDIGDQDAVAGFEGYDSRVFGTMVGFDKSCGHDTRIGVAAGYARSEIDGKTFDTDTNIETYHATGYFGREFGQGFLYGDLSYGTSDYAASRHIVFPGVDRRAISNYDGESYTAFVAAGRHYSSSGLTITPMASLQYSRIDLDRHAETGAGDINLDVAQEDYDFLESGLGVRVADSFGFRGSRYTPDVHMKWLHLIENPTLSDTASFLVAGSPSFTTPGFKANDDTFNFGFGIASLTTECNSLEVTYDYNWRTDQYSSHQGLVKYTSRF